MEKMYKSNEEFNKKYPIRDKCVRIYTICMSDIQKIRIRDIECNDIDLQIKIINSEDGRYNNHSYAYKNIQDCINHFNKLNV